MRGEEDLTVETDQASAEAAAMLAEADPAVVGRPLPVVEVVVETFNRARPPVRAGGPFRVTLTRAVLVATPAQRRFCLAHELGHICGAKALRAVLIPWAVGVPAVAAVVLVVGSSPVRSRIHGHAGLIGVVMFAVVVAGAAAAWLGWVRFAARIRPEEVAMDRFAAQVFGAAVTQFDMERWGESEPRLWNRWGRTHPFPAEREAATNAALRSARGT